MNISSRDLEAFLALAETQHFTRAAERCHLSQSAFSQKISRLERMTGVPLFERSTRHVALTPEGEVFADEARRIRQDLQHAVLHLQELANRRSGKVALAALPSVAAAWMPAAIQRYRSLYPSIRIELFDTLADGALAMLREGRVDIAITAGGDLDEFEVQEVKNEAFYLVCHHGHRLAPEPGVELAQLQDEELIQLARSSSVRQHLEAAGLTARPGALEVEHLGTVAALVAHGLGVSVVPELTLFHFARPGIVTVPLLDPPLRRPIYLARRKGKALSSAARAMVEEVLAAARGPAPT